MKNVYVMLTSKRVAGTDFPPEKGVGVFADKKEAEKQQALFYANKANGCLADAQIVKAPIVGGRKDGKGAKNVRYGYSYVDGGDSCDGFPRSGRRLYDTPEKAKRAMVADARFYAKANEIDPDEIVESKFCTDYRCEIKGSCVWQTFKVEC